MSQNPDYKINRNIFHNLFSSVPWYLLMCVCVYILLKAAIFYKACLI